jgi:hypothetical protein
MARRDDCQIPVFYDLRETLSAACAKAVERFNP